MMVPESLKQKLNDKLVSQTMDAGSSIALAFDGDNNRHVLVSTRDFKMEDDIFVVDLWWKFPSFDYARGQLRQSAALRERVCSLLGPAKKESNDVALDELMDMVMAYSASFEETDEASGSSVRIFYLLDEVGSRLLPPSGDDEPQCEPMFQSALVSADTETFLVMWACRDFEEGEVITCGNLPYSLRRSAALVEVFAGLRGSDDGTELEENVGTAVEAEHEVKDDNDIGSGTNQEDDVEKEESDSESRDAFAVALDLGSRLATLGYSVSGVSHRLGLAGLGHGLPCWELCSANHHAALLAQLKETRSGDVGTHDDDGDELEVLIRLFLLGLPVTDTSAHRALGADLVAKLLLLRVLHDATGTRATSGCLLMKATLQLSPVDVPHNQEAHAMPPPPPSVAAVSSPISRDTVWVFTDFAMVGSGLFEPVMYVGPDSLALIHALPTTFGGGSDGTRALDLCSGCGVQALCLAASGRASEVVCMELSPRAVSLARFNVALNGLQGRVRVLQGDVCEIRQSLSRLGHDDKCTKSTPGFNLVTLNPPYIPTGDAAVMAEKEQEGPAEQQLLAYGAGGVQGEDITGAVLRQLARSAAVGPERVVEPGATVAIVANLVNVREYPQKMSSWLGCESGADEPAAAAWRAAVRHGVCWSPSTYAGLILRERNDSGDGRTIGRERELYTRALQAAGVDDVCNGLVFARVSRDGVEGSTDKPLPVPVDISECDEQLWVSLAASINHPGDAPRDLLQLGDSLL